ncbi:MAG: 2-C-methyl-D-erythritol 4-phosphate cytidylyltransferase [Planctomycetaceae bacterium]|jgi:2-C-methyl-D-erythritol 4-phosphate cytidylyltransferase|nr:2-C-methyl-D-erythritol 4-phosphate cytidylyltransferase [Planctomycetaceae bacterium]
MTAKKINISVIHAAAGKSTRFAQRRKKIFSPLCGKPVWLHSVERFASFQEVTQQIVVVAPEDRVFFLSEYAEAIREYHLEIADGGTERFESSENGLRRVSQDADFTAVHDAARPCVSRELVRRVFDAAVQYGAAVPASPIVGTLKRSNAEHQIQETVSRGALWEAQTPQVFRHDWILEGFARRDDSPVTDDAQLLEKIGRPVHIVASNRYNIKITTQDDLVLAELILNLEKTQHENRIF